MNTACGNRRPIRVLFIDHNPKFLAAAGHFLATELWLEIVGTVHSGREGVEQVARLQPDLVLVDVAIPGLNGLEVTRQLKSRLDAPRIIILTLYDNPEYRAKAACLGADGLVAKSDFGTQLLPLICALFDLMGTDEITVHNEAT
jgi:DNA-binding NarL/FixJ family response regulator